MQSPPPPPPLPSLPPFHTAHTVLSTSLIFTERAGSRGAGKGCHHHRRHLISFPGGGGDLLFSFPVHESSPSFPSFPNKELLSRCVCACVTRIAVACSHKCFRCFLRRILFKIQGKDRKPPFCTCLNGTSVDESWAPCHGLIGKGAHRMHICSHAHFLPPPRYPSHAHAHVFLPLSPFPFQHFNPFRLQRFQVSSRPNWKPLPPTTPPPLLPQHFNPSKIQCLMQSLVPSRLAVSHFRSRPQAFLLPRQLPVEGIALTLFGQMYIVLTIDRVDFARCAIFVGSGTTRTRRFEIRLLSSPLTSCYCRSS